MRLHQTEKLAESKRGSQSNKQTPNRTGEIKERERIKNYPDRLRQSRTSSNQTEWGWGGQGPVWLPYHQKAFQIPKRRSAAWLLQWPGVWAWPCIAPSSWDSRPTLSVSPFENSHHPWGSFVEGTGEVSGKVIHLLVWAWRTWWPREGKEYMCG